MNPQIIIIDEPLKAYITTNGETLHSRQLIFHFPNDYGASVITGAGAHGLEMARILFTDDEEECVICEEPYCWLTNEELNKMLYNIKETGYAKESAE